MKLPNGYGSVIKLGGKKRKSYAVRITTGFEQNSSGKYVQKYKYLEYFEKSKDAYAYLSEYNAGIKLKEHISITDLPSFAEVYEMWISFKASLNKKPSDSTFRNYDIAFRQLSDLHNLKFRNIRLADLQPVVSKYKGKSESTNRMITTVLHGMYEYALKYDLVEKDYSKLLTVEWTEAFEKMHRPFNKKEISRLWENKDMNDVYIILIMIYSGLRMSEFLTLETKNIHLDERYMIAGMKTKAGKNRTIPINEKIVQFFSLHMNEESKYFYPNSKGEAYSFSTFNNTNWKNLMKIFNMDHKTHDARHTFATLLKSAGVNDFHRKLILGHAVSDFTDRVYTHVSIEELVLSINKI